MEDQSRSFDSGILAVIDMQNGVVSQVVGREKLIRNVARTVESARTLGIRPYFFCMSDTNLFDPRWGGSQLIEGEEAYELDRSIRMKREERLYVKHAYSAFSNGDFVRDLKRNGVRSLWLCGAMAHVCVLATALDAYSKGFNVVVVPEAVGAGNRGDLVFGVDWIVRYAGHVVSLGFLEDLALKHKRSHMMA